MYLDGAITAPKAPKLSVYRVASRGVAKKRANRNKSLDISEATRRGTRRAARGDRNGEGEGEQAQRDVRTFLIYERAYFLGLLHMDISSGTERCEPRRMRESAEQRPRGACTFLFPPRCPILSFFFSFSLFLSSPPRTALVNRVPHLDTCYDVLWSRVESWRIGKRRSEDSKRIDGRRTRRSWKRVALLKILASWRF